MSYDQLIPAGALDRPESPLIPPPRAPEHERVLVCNGCGQTILVCGYVDDLDPTTYRGCVCGCRQPVDERALELRSKLAAERAHAAATGQGIPFRPEVA